MDSKFLHHEECPKCGSRNNVAVYSNGGRHCFSADCDYHVNGETGEEEEDRWKKGRKSKWEWNEVAKGPKFGLLLN